MKRIVWVNLVLAITALIVVGCEKKGTETSHGTKAEEQKVMSINTESFGKTPDGQEVDLYTMTNTNGITAKITNYGAILVSLEVPDKNGKPADITLGFDTLDGYIKGHPYFGATVGRYANRIGGAKFKLNDVEYQLAANNGPNHLHGGIKGFDKVVWKAEDVTAESDKAMVKLSYLSKDGEEG
ncbi:MAG: galactose-1-epimerase, partial [Phycisphaerae bacterium]|nr:galactose-1-epimerase [Phycisphaerae bacterium]